MLKTLIAAGIIFFTTNVLAQAQAEIHCVLSPRLYVGNTYLDLDLQNKLFQISFDDIDAGHVDNVISVSGRLYWSGKDSMGFDRIALCTSQPCSGETYLGELKATDQHDGKLTDRVSYLSVNPNSNVKIKVQRFRQEFYLQGSEEFACDYKATELAAKELLFQKRGNRIMSAAPSIDGVIEFLLSSKS